MRRKDHGVGLGRRIRCAAGAIVVGLTLSAPPLLAAAPGNAVSADAPPAVAVAEGRAWTRDDAAHLLRRAGFGGTPEQIDRLLALGRDGAVDYLLTGQAPAAAQGAFAPAALEDFKPSPPPQLDPELVKRAEAGRALRQAAKARAAQGQAAGGAATRPVQGQAAGGAATRPAGSNADEQAALAAAQEIQKQLQRAQQVDLQRLRTWWVDRMIRTDRPLEEKMTLFWHGLFTSGIREVKSASFLVEQNGLFHREATGNFKQLAHDVIHGGAMLRYLNNDQNTRGAPNENLARELMELFTMGEGKGYTETDIREVARALTGLAPVGGKRFGDGTVVLRQRLHDDGMKTIFGKRGNFGPDDVVGLIFDRPEPARHLARKLWEFFAYPDPSDEDLAPVVAALHENNYELKPALRAMFTSPAFYAPRAKFALIKSPAELTVEEVRTLGITPSEDQAFALVRRMGAMEQQLLQPPNVRGWVGGDNWITVATLYTRYNTASAIVHNAVPLGGAGGRGKDNKGQNRFAAYLRQEPPRAGGPGEVAPAALFAALGRTPSPEAVVDAAVARFLQRPLSPEKRGALLDVIGLEPLELGTAPGDARVRQMICLLMSTPEYQVH